MQGVLILAILQDVLENYHLASSNPPVTAAQEEDEG